MSRLVRLRIYLWNEVGQSLFVKKFEKELIKNRKRFFLNKFGFWILKEKFFSFYFYQTRFYIIAKDKSLNVEYVQDIS